MITDEEVKSGKISIFEHCKIGTERDVNALMLMLDLLPQIELNIYDELMEQLDDPLFRRLIRPNLKRLEQHIEKSCKNMYQVIKDEKGSWDNDKSIFHARYCEKLTNILYSYVFGLQTIGDDSRAPREEVLDYVDFSYKLKKGDIFIIATNEVRQFCEYVVDSSCYEGEKLVIHYSKVNHPNARFVMLSEFEPVIITSKKFQDENTRKRFYEKLATFGASSVNAELNRSTNLSHQGKQ